MTLPDKHLFRKLTIAVLIKLAVLAVPWWLFVRDVGVYVYMDSVADG